MSSRARAVVVYVVLIVVALLMWAVVPNGPHTAVTSYTQFLQQVQSGQVNSATIVAFRSGANRVNYRLKDGREVHTVVPLEYGRVLEILQEKMVDIEIVDTATQGLRVVANASPFLVLIMVWAFMMWRMRGRGVKI